ncbi:MAG: sigma-70 family RNA polymerase sigma factor [Dorea sp.]|nr:sigma-70 family RNA polymerase sigma factor [Dorea sp.]
MAELAGVARAIDKLNEKLGYAEEEYIVSGKVKKSSKDFPYIEEHMTVVVPDPKHTGPIWARIREKERRKAELEAEITEVEAFIAGLPDGLDKQIFEMVFLDGMTQQKAGEVIGYSKGRISQIISGYVKD